MKQLLIILLIFLAACSNRTTEDSQSKNAQIKEAESLRVDFDFSTNNFVLDSSTNYGAGDCWGNVFQYSLNDSVIGIDSMICSEYGFIISKYLFINGEISIIYSKQSNTFLGLYGEKDTYELIEKYYDLTKTPKLCIQRIDTVLEPKPELIKNEFKFIEYDSVAENLIMSYRGAWEEDYNENELERSKANIIGAYGFDDNENAYFGIYNDSIYYPDPNLWSSWELSGDTIVIKDEDNYVEKLLILKLTNDSLVVVHLDYDVINRMKRR